MLAVLAQEGGSRISGTTYLSSSQSSVAKQWNATEGEAELVGWYSKDSHRPQSQHYMWVLLMPWLLHFPSNS